MKTSEAADYLNEILALDPKAANALLGFRVPVSPSLSEHPEMVVRKEEGGGFTVGLLGVINGLLGRAGEGHVAVALDEETGEAAWFEEYGGPPPVSVRVPSEFERFGTLCLGDLA